jgi:hypothetical protein
MEWSSGMDWDGMDFDVVEWNGFGFGIVDSICVETWVEWNGMDLKLWIVPAWNCW